VQGTSTQLSLVKLADLKRGPYNPVLPTLRQYDRDTMKHRLPDRHCRTTTPLTQRDFSFSREGGVPFVAPRMIHCHHITATGRSLAHNLADRKALEIDQKRFQQEFCSNTAKDLRTAQILACGPPADIPDVNIDGYMVRYLRPDTRGWSSRYTPLPRKAPLDKNNLQYQNDAKVKQEQEKLERSPAFNLWEPYRGRRKDLPHWRSNIGF